MDNNFGIFLSDPSPIIGYPWDWLTDGLTHSCLVDLTDVTLEFEDANSNYIFSYKKFLKHIDKDMITRLFLTQIEKVIFFRHKQTFLI